MTPGGLVAVLGLYVVTTAAIARAWYEAGRRQGYREGREARPAACRLTLTEVRYLRRAQREGKSGKAT